MAADTPLTRDFLFEIGTEELPPQWVLPLAQALQQGVVQGLDKAQIAHGTAQCFATPRRLAVLISDVATQQPDQHQQRRGPALRAAFDAEGKPTKAAQGFAQSCGVNVEQLDRMETDKGAWLVYRQTQQGQAAEILIPNIVTQAVDGLPIPKRMRWGAGEATFSRPVRWLLVLFGDQPIPLRLFDLDADTVSYCHRFHHPDPITIPCAADYITLLHEPGVVIADFAERRARIHQQVEQVAAAAGGKAVVTDALLDEVTALTEWPVAILGHFEERFLQVPAEALITTMQYHQRYFPVVDTSGQLMPCFITISNLRSQNPEQVRIGNERVIRPRFSDAEFFWNQDRARPLAVQIERLETVIFQQKLGTLRDKSTRVQALAVDMAQQLNAPVELARRAAELAKCDLLTDMVQEFPELQGVMGSHYARHDGESAEVAQALEEQYHPAFAGDTLPQTLTGQILAVAERLDTLVGIFAIGQAPTGNRDPFALRRAALGVNRILIECRLPLDCESLLQKATIGYTHQSVDAESIISEVFDFIFERLRAYYQEREVDGDLFAAVLANRPTQPLDFDRRLQAVSAFRELPEAADLIAANKRIRNILRKITGPLAVEPDTAMLREPAEQTLLTRMIQITPGVIAQLEQADYATALSQLATLRDPVDQFFDQVMVMADDITVRNNRLALLAQLDSVFNQVADLSRLR